MKTEEDSRDMKIAGCDVHLVFTQTQNHGWTVIGTVASGTAENKAKETITSGPWPSRDIAEQKALEEITTLMGHNEDRSTSRVHNPGERRDGQNTDRESTR